MHVWCDNPTARSEAQIATAIHDRLRVMAQHTWGSPKPAPLYLLFSPLIKAVGAAPATLTTPLHPNVTGQRNLAELVVDTLGGPSTRGAAE